MLCLSRYEDQRIMIGDDIVITVIGVRDKKVRLGIDAPAAVKVHREEVYQEIQRENAKRGSSA